MFEISSKCLGVKSVNNISLLIIKNHPNIWIYFILSSEINAYKNQNNKSDINHS